MKAKKYDFLYELADDETIEEIAMNYPVLSKTEKQHIAELCEEKTAMNRQNNENEELYRVDEVSGNAEVITKTPWYRSPVLSIAAAVVIAAGVGTAALVNNFGGNTPGALIDSEDGAETEVEESAEEMTEEAEEESGLIPDNIEDYEPVMLQFEIDLSRNAGEHTYMKLYEVDGDNEKCMMESGLDRGKPFSGGYGNGGKDTNVRIEIFNEDNGLSATIGHYFLDFTNDKVVVLDEDPQAALEAVGALGDAEDDTPGIERRTEQFEIDLPEKAEGRFIISFMCVEGNKADTVETPVFYCPEVSHISQEVEIYGERMAITLHNLQNDKDYPICAFDLLTDEIELDKDFIYNAFLEVDGIKET